ncbi:MAG: hypothetical protein FWC45_04760 [Treponema sp.]|nr:hypothetical protein [Treponema sp.]
MNQDEVKKKLLAIEDAPLDFSVIFSGKRSKKVNGLYKPDTREIIIHNRNFTGEGTKAAGRGTSAALDAAAAEANLLMYTAIHEYAHHLHACARGGHLSPRAHTAEFWAILHGLLEKAEAKGIYQDVFAGSKELEKLTDTIRKKYLTENGNLVKELGQLLLKARELCSAIGGRYEDYIDRVLRIPRQAANLAVRMHQYNLNPETGADNMRFLAGISNEEKRLAAENALMAGKSPDTVKAALRKKSEDEDPRQNLEKEKIRLERTIASLTKRLEEVEKELAAP